VFKVLAQTVPDAAKNDTVREMELYLGTMIRQVDSSLLEEWEKCATRIIAPAKTARPPLPTLPRKSARPAPRKPPPTSPATAAKAFTAAIRNRIFG
jgi:hypothetical protein